MKNLKNIWQSENFLYFFTAFDIGLKNLGARTRVLAATILKQLFFEK